MKQKDNIVAVVVVALLVLAAVWVGSTQLNVVKDTPVLPDGSTLSCSGIASVTNTLSAKNNLRPGTAVTGEYMFITTNGIGAKSVGALSGLTPAKSYESLLFHNSTGYFAEKYDFSTTCSNADATVFAAAPGAPTVSFVNNNGVTLNSVSAAEAVDADQTYTAEITVRAPGAQFSSRHGALLVAEWDKTYVKNVEINGLSLESSPNYLSHTTLLNTTTATGDAFRAFSYNGELKDGAKVTFTFTFETTSETPGANNANIAFHWVAKDLHIDSRTLEISGPAVEDRDNSFIGLANTTAIYYTS